MLDATEFVQSQQLLSAYLTYIYIIWNIWNVFLKYLFPIHINILLSTNVFDTFLADVTDK